MSLVIPRRPFSPFLFLGVSWFLAAIILIVMLTVFFAIQAAWLTPVTKENKERLEERFRRQSVSEVLKPDTHLVHIGLSNFYF